MSKGLQCGRFELSSLLLLLLAGCGESAVPELNAGKDSGAVVITIQAAASTGEALAAALEGYPQAGRVKFAVNYGSSAALAQQVLAGAEVDLFLSASEEWVAKLAAENLVEQSTNLVGNQLAVVVPRDADWIPSNLQELAAPQLKRLAIGEPDSVPAGIYVRQALEKADLWQEFEPRLVRGADVRQALTFVERGEAEAGIVYATDAAASSAVCVAFTIDAGLASPIVYPLALVKRDGDRSVAKAVYAYLASPAARSIFVQHGFLPIGE